MLFFSVIPQLSSASTLKADTPFEVTVSFFSAAQCLHTVTEDNVPSLQLLVSSQETLTQLEQLLAQANTTTGSGLLLKTSIAGL